MDGCYDDMARLVNDIQVSEESLHKQVVSN